MKNIWKEHTANLQAKKEYIHIIQTKNVNTVFIRNSNVSMVKAGIKPNEYETIINTNQVGIITRPFRLDYIYLFSEKTTHVNIIETKMENTDNFIRRKIKKNVIIQNTPNICLKPTHGKIIVPHFCKWVRFPPDDFEYVIDLGEYGRPIINIYNTTHIICPTTGELRTRSRRLYIFGSHDNTSYFLITGIMNGGCLFYTLNNIPYRFIKFFIYGERRNTRVCLEVVASR